MIRNNLLRSFKKFAKNSLNYFHQNTYLNLLKFIYLYLQFLIMTRDSESVESWTAHLLKSIASRRVSFISVNASAKSQNADISWNIKIEKQLCNKLMISQTRSSRCWMSLNLNKTWLWNSMSSELLFKLNMTRDWIN